MTLFIDQKSISSGLAGEMVKRAIDKAEELGVAVNVAVVDQGANLLAFSRMDGAPILSSGIAKNKAYSAAAFGVPTHEWYDMIKDEPSLLTGIVHTDRLTVFGGGYPVYADGLLAGAIGVSGGTLEEDQACCEAALELLQNIHK